MCHCLGRSEQKNGALEILVMFWNGRGVGKKGMGSKLRELVWEHELDFICFQETTKNNYKPNLIRRIDPQNQLVGIFSLLKVSQVVF
jgi:hypothetical protein